MTAQADGSPQERWVHVPGGRVWTVRHTRTRPRPGTARDRTGEELDRPVLLVLHGGPGLPSDYLHGLAALTRSGEVDVVLFDQLGCGRSERPDDPSLWTVTRAVAEVEAVRSGLGLGRVHLLGHSWGAFLALSYQAKHSAHVNSLVMSSPLVSVPRWIADAQLLVDALPEHHRDAIRLHEAAGSFEDPEYVAATEAFYRLHLCALDPWPDSLQRTFQQMGQQTYQTMWGPSEFTATGILRGADLSDRLPTLDLPSLWLCGTRDEVRPETLRDLAAAAHGKVHVLDGGTHCLHLEQPSAYLDAVQAFLSPDVP